MTNELVLYKKIWNGIAISVALQKKDYYAVSKKFIEIGDKTYYLNPNTNTRVLVDKNKLYSRLENDGFDIVEKENDEIITSYFGISREKIISHTKGNEKKIK